MNYWKTMILTVSALLYLCGDILAQSISLEMKNVTIKEVIAKLSKDGYSFVYASEDLDTRKTVSIQAKRLDEALAQLLKGQPLTYEIEDKNIIIRKRKSTDSFEQDIEQKKNITGKVTDSQGEPIIGANVLEIGNSSNGTITDVNGDFSLSVPSNAKIRISYIGYSDQVFALNGRSSVVIQLQEDTELLDEVVVVGFGTQKKVNLTGAVSVVTADAIQERPVSNVTQALQGMVPGLQISQNTGTLETSPTINIRGTATIGQGTSGDPLILIDGMEGDINSINPQDIENISVLKDAAASSIYGSRAPFGVILITTKSGSAEGKTNVNYNNSFRFGTPIKLNRLMNSVDFSSWLNDAQTNSGSGVYVDENRMQQIVEWHNASPYKPGQRITADGTILYSIPAGDNGMWKDAYAYGIDDVDWFGEVYKDWTFTQEHNFSVNGGSKKLDYYASLGYMGQDGLLNLGDDGLQRYTATAKLNSQVTDWLKFHYNMRFTRMDYHRPSEYTNNLLWDLSRQTWPMLPLYDPNGYWYEGPSVALRLGESGDYKTQTDNIYQQIGLEIEPIKNWVTHIDFNYRTLSMNLHEDYKLRYNHDVNGQAVQSTHRTDSSVKEEQQKENYYNFNAYTEYTHSFKDAHNLHIMGGFQAENLKQTKFSAKAYGILFPEKPEINLTDGTVNGEARPAETSGERNEWSTAGFFARLNYDYLGKYLLEMNVRADGSSRFRKGNQWKTFPSVSLGWNIAHENFFKSLTDKISMLKLRASYGSLGNQNTSNWYYTYQTLNVQTNNRGWLINGSKPNTATTPQLVSTSLTWETIESWDIGLDWGLFNNRLTGSFDYYVRNTKNMVGNAPELPLILGTAVPVTNNTDLRTLGWEVSVAWHDQLDNGLYYGASFNVADARSKIMRYPNNPTNAINTYIAGRYLNEIWGYETVGLARTDEEMQAHLATLPNGGQDALGSDWKAGDIMYADLNHDGKISAGSGTLDDPGDKKVIGNSTPRFLFGLDLNASWKGFDISAFFQGVMKRDYWQGSTYMFGTAGKDIWWSTGLREVHDYFRNEDTWSVAAGYQQPNTDAYLPRPLWNTSKNVQYQTGYLQSAAYIRLKNLQIGYTLSQQLTKRWGIEKLRIFFSGENLWTGTSLAKQFDPETISGGNDGLGGNSGSTYPLQMTLSCGLNITF